MSSANEDDLRRATEEYQQFILDYDHQTFVNKCKEKSRLLIESPLEGARFVAEQAISALEQSKGLMMIRIGDGEANLLRYARNETEFELKWVNQICQIHDHQTLSVENARMISREIAVLLGDADIIGLRAFAPISIKQQLAAVSDALEKGDIRGALGVIGALSHADRAITNGELSHAVLTSAWVHLGLLEHLDRLLAVAPRVVVISGRTELEGLFSQRLKGRLTAFLSIPVQASDTQWTPERASHFPVRYGQILEALQTDLRGTLVLVGAGIFGKKYCAVSKKNGGVALDLGSAFDILAGKRTRPVHANPSFVDTKVWTHNLIR